VGAEYDLGVGVCCNALLVKECEAWTNSEMPLAFSFSAALKKYLGLGQ
jgi:hypothetical protein